jgi:hypothetical protein
VIERNSMFHREVYGLLHKILITEAPTPFRFLNIACGDAMGSAAALNGTGSPATKHFLPVAMRSLLPHAAILRHSEAKTTRLSVTFCIQKIFGVVDGRGTRRRWQGSC